jgi:hypothetical protein
MKGFDMASLEQFVAPVASKYAIDGVELFQLFDFDAGKVYQMPELVGESLYSFRPTSRTDKTHDFSALSANELKKLQDEERAARVAQMAEMFNDFGLEEMSDEELEKNFGDGGLCGMLDAPKYLPKAQPQEENCED